jgi:hypothetical protein
MDVNSATQMFFVLIALPALFGLTLVGEGIYQMSHYERGWMNICLGSVFLMVVAFAYFFLKGLV